MPDQEIKVPNKISKVRLDKFLVEGLGFTRSKVQRIIKDGLVKIDGVVPSVHHWLKAGEKILVKDRLAELEILAPKLNILDETDDYIVLKKQAGVIVHPATGSRAPVLTKALVEYCPSIAKVGDPARPGIVHRLDREVSGVMVVAKTKAMYDSLTQQFKDRQIKKVYTALVHGNIEREEGIIDFPIARSKTKLGRMVSRPTGSIGHLAETEFLVLERFVNYTLLEVIIRTGRTHQIRTHLKAIRHSIVGDELYKQRGLNEDKKHEPSRLFLQSIVLGFNDLNNEWKEYKISLDKDFEDFLHKLK